MIVEWFPEVDDEFDDEHEFLSLSYKIILLKHFNLYQNISPYFKILIYTNYNNK